MLSKVERDLLLLLYLFLLVILSERDLLLLLYLFLLVILSERDLLLLLYLFLLVILSERGPRRTLQPGGGESKDLLLFFHELLTHYTG